MRPTRILGITVLVLVLLIVVVLLLGRRTANDTAIATITPVPTVEATASTSVSPSPSAVSVTITYNGSSFSPASVTVKSGGTLTIRNTSSSTVDPNSDPHPQHTDDTDLNFGNIAAGSSATMTLTKIGTFGIHNHLNPSQTGSVTIQ
ncbi:MAG: Plastocyanin [Conexibacter sp.]|nr:Plastocyanin [Conexibacter sp.]